MTSMAEGPALLAAQRWPPIATVQMSAFGNGYRAWNVWNRGAKPPFIMRAKTFDSGELLALSPPETNRLAASIQLPTRTTNAGSKSLF